MRWCGPRGIEKRMKNIPGSSQCPEARKATTYWSPGEIWKWYRPFSRPNFIGYAGHVAEEFGVDDFAALARLVSFVDRSL